MTDGPKNRGWWHRILRMFGYGDVRFERPCGFWWGVRTPLFAVVMMQRCPSFINGPNTVYDGIAVSFWPKDWRFPIREGVMFAAHYRWGWDGLQKREARWN